MNNSIKALTKSEMRIIVGGAKRIYCRIGGVQADYNLFTNLVDAASACEAIARADGTICGGCAEFTDDMDQLEVGN